VSHPDEDKKNPKQAIHDGHVNVAITITVAVSIEVFHSCPYSGYK